MRHNNIKQVTIWIAAICIAASSCSKQMEEKPYSSIFNNNFYQTASDAEGALIAAYGPLASLYHTAGTCVGDFSADQLYPRPVVGRETYTLFNYDDNYTTQKSFSRGNESAQQIWQSCYSGIEKANWVIARVPATNMNEDRKAVIIAEAYFLRAFYHWTLAKNFGDIVIKITPSTDIEGSLIGTSDKQAIYAQIFDDLTEAEKSLPSYSQAIQKGRPSIEVALALHAKAALYAENWQLAESKAKEVITSGKYNLLADVRDLFDVEKEDAARQENMWALEAERSVPGFSTQLIGLYGPRNSDGPAYGPTSFGSIFAYQSFFDSFDPADKRRLLLDTNYVNKQGQVVAQKDITPITPKGVLIKKYMDANANGGNGAINVQIFRLADVHLIAAEAEVRNGGTVTAAALENINIVRRRAGVAELAAGLSNDDFIAKVLQERSWELFAEGDRWYDLTRTNTYMQVIPLVVNDVFPVRSPQARNRYFPIPLEEINANPNIERNPAWN